MKRRFLKYLPTGWLKRHPLFPPPLKEPKAGLLGVPYAPDLETTIVETPPRFSWVPVADEGVHYVLQVSTDRGFSSTATSTFEDIPYCFFTPDVPLSPGAYHWRYAAWDRTAKRPASGWSKVRSFHVPEGLPETPLPARQNRFANVSTAHPRLWMDPERLATFQDALRDDPDHCTWSKFFEKSVLPWMQRDICKEPEGYPGDKRVIEIWRKTYLELQEVFYAVRHLAIGGKVTNDAAMVARAKAWLLEVASWDPAGVTSHAYTDEWGFRVCNTLTWGYDWLYEDLSPHERKLVRDVLIIRTREIATHIMSKKKIHLFPYDSHPVRSVVFTLIPACIALLEDDADNEAKEWLNYCIEFLMTLYSPWGDNDGGWAEGPHYWMIGLAYLLDAASRLKTYTGIDICQRPFYQHAGDFPLFCKAPNTRRATFGDDGALGDMPPIKTGLNMRQFAGMTGKGEYQWYADENLRTNQGTEGEVYNWGWWDTNFDELVYRTDFPVVSATPPQGGLRHFRGIGWVGVQHAMDDLDEHIQFVFKASRFGSVSHSHGDQNAFCLAGYGEELAIQSGHYVAANSSMHWDWRKQTKAKNAIMINGNGQYAGPEKQKAIAASGRICAAEDRGDHIYIHGDATAAYQSLSPEVRMAEREVFFVDNSYFVLVDTVMAEDPVTVEWLLHANGPFAIDGQSFRYMGQRAGLYGEVIWADAGPPRLEQETGFPGVDPQEYAGAHLSTFLTARYPSATKHRIATLLVPYRLDAPKSITSTVSHDESGLILDFSGPHSASFRVYFRGNADQESK